MEGLIVGCPTCGCWLDEQAAAQAHRHGRPLRCPQCAGPVAWPAGGPETGRQAGPDRGTESSETAGAMRGRGGRPVGATAGGPGSTARVRPRRVSGGRGADGRAASATVRRGPADQSGSTDFTSPS